MPVFAVTLSDQCKGFTEVSSRMWKRFMNLDTSVYQKNTAKEESTFVFLVFGVAIE